MCKIIGIDISKQTFDVSFKRKERWDYFVFPNEEKGFKQLLNLIEQVDWVVMEASGSYYFPLATFLSSRNIKVCVENPLVIKRFSQTMLYRAKTDKKDARTIAEYGEKYDLKQWEQESENCTKLRHLYTRVELLNKQIQQNKRQLEAFESSGSLDKFLEKTIKKDLSNLEKTKHKIEVEMERLAKQQYGQTIENIESIPGIGRKTAMMLSLITDNFKKFENYKQLIAYVGFSPRIYQSGTSVKGKGHICKMGKAQIRKLLYMCSWSAKHCNKTCKEMYDRLKSLGKPERVIKIAIANKLLKQAFAIAKANGKYQENYC
ncbi:IS110 family transposase [Flavobacterium sp. I3-2]|uniref:IS110 family transposase n=1 Tax=Flavobacterium sp. I3-2 TaxID=2748319 RepID=UPI0015B0581F|nr:IS110 family transposase [Flavobacterium sp. I3-2]